MKAIIYTRVSTDEQANKGHGRDYQLEVLKGHCKYNKYEIVAEYQDDHSAKNFNRPEWKKLETYAKANRKQVDIVLFTKWDRFSRNLEESLSKIRTFRNWGININSVEQSLDFANPDNKMMLSIYLTSPEIENDKISERTRAGMHKSAKDGGWGGRVPYGYKRCKVGKYASLEPNEDTEIVVEMFKQASTHLGSMEQLRKSFMSLGYKASKQSFYNLLRNQVYLGMAKVPEFKKEDTYWVDGFHDAVIDESTFNKVQNILLGNKKNAKLPSKKNESLPLRGFLECELCGGTLTGSPSKGNGGTYYYYHCRSGCKNRLRSEKVHKMFKVEILNKISVSDNVLDLYKEILIDIQTKKKGLKKVKQNKLDEQIRVVEKQIESTEDLLVTEKITTEAFNKIVKRYNHQLRDLKYELQLIEESKETPKSVIERAHNTMRSIPKLYEGGNYDKKLELLGLIFPERLIISKNGCRTKKLNIVIELLTRVNNGFKSIGKEKAIISDGLSNYAPPLGLEPRTL